MSGTASGSAGEYSSALKRLVVEAVGLAALVVWTGFWLNVVRLHYQQGDVLSAAITGTLFVATAVAAYLVHAGSVLGLDLPGTPVSG